VWNKPVEEIIELLPQYVIAREQEGLKGENAQIYERKKAEFNQLINDCPLEDNSPCKVLMPF
jgi:hypothetical protein